MLVGQAVSCHGGVRRGILGLSLAVNAAHMLPAYSLQPTLTVYSLQPTAYSPQLTPYRFTATPLRVTYTEKGEHAGTRGGDFPVDPLEVHF
jgi:hypothetical protein